MNFRTPKSIVSICKGFTHEIDAAITAQRAVVKTANAELIAIRKKELTKMSTISDAELEIKSGNTAIVNIKQLFGITK